MTVLVLAGQSGRPTAVVSVPDDYMVARKADPLCDRRYDWLADHLLVVQVAIFDEQDVKKLTACICQNVAGFEIAPGISFWRLIRRPLLCSVQFFLVGHPTA